MPTTDPSLVTELLVALERSGIAFAVLHDEDRIGQTTGDVDIVADRPAHRIVADVRDWPARCHPVMVWPYEPGGAANLFVVDTNLTDGAQVDILFDPEARGRLGLRSHRLLVATRQGVRFPVLAHHAELAYLMRKRVVKNDPQRLTALVEVARGEGSGFLAGVADLGGTAYRASLADALAGRLRGRASGARPGFRHMLGRLREPVGAWIHHVGADAEEAAGELHRRATRIFPHTASGPVGGHIHRAASWPTAVAPVRYRPGIYTSWGGEAGVPRPDLQLPTSDPAGVVTWMESRVRSRSAA